MPTVDEVRRAKKSAASDLLKRSGITGVGVGYKITGGKKTDELSIRVYVEDKRDVPERQMISPVIDGVKTDVVERKFVLHPLYVPVSDVVPMADTGTYATLQGGISLGPCRSLNITAADMACHGVTAPGAYLTGGTLGAIVTDNASGDAMMLSNYHVMALDDAWTAGDTMAQPSLLDTGSCPADIVGQLQRAVLGGHVDCAVASITNRPHSCDIVEIGDVAGTAEAVLEEPVRKRGRTTGLTYGTVDDIDMDVTIDYCNGLGSVTLTDQIGIEVDAAQSSQIGNHGDSGSVVVNADNEIIGLYFAGTPAGTYGAANPIQAVLDALDVSVCVPAPKTIFKDFKDNKEHVKDVKWEKLEPKEHKLEKIEVKETKIEVKELIRDKLEQLEGKGRSPKELKEGKEIYEVPEIPITQPFRQSLLAQSLTERGYTRQMTTTAELSVCIDFQQFGPTVLSNPFTYRGMIFTAFDHASNPWPDPGIYTWGGFTGFQCGFTLVVQFPQPCREVEVTLVHFSSPASVEAYNTDGMLAGTASMSGPEQQAETLAVSGESIGHLLVYAPQNETLLLTLCCRREEQRQPPIDRRDKPALADYKGYKFEKPEKYEIKEWKETIKDFKEPKEIREHYPVQPLQPSGGTGVQQRLDRIEAALAQLTHFISPELRPDLSTGALAREPDVRGDLAARSRLHQKQASDAKRVKDAKDVEKPIER